jgi:hypothetical protein
MTLLPTEGGSEAAAGSTPPQRTPPRPAPTTSRAAGRPQSSSGRAPRGGVERPDGDLLRRAERVCFVAAHGPRLACGAGREPSNRLFTRTAVPAAR